MSYFDQSSHSYIFYFAVFSLHLYLSLEYLKEYLYTSVKKFLEDDLAMSAYLFYIKYMYLDFFWKLLTKNSKIFKVYKYSGYLVILKRLPGWLSGKESTCHRESCRRFRSILLFSVLFYLLFFCSFLACFWSIETITPFYIFIWIIYTLSIFVILLGYTIYYFNHIYLQILLYHKICRVII